MVESIVDCTAELNSTAVASAAEERGAQLMRELVEYVLECGEAWGDDDPSTAMEGLLP
eukprot:COSAG01_NODE_34395_length_548_cov_1.180401_1_plen_57_part_10